MSSDSFRRASRHEATRAVLSFCCICRLLSSSCSQSQSNVIGSGMSFELQLSGKECSPRHKPVDPDLSSWEGLKHVGCHCVVSAAAHVLTGHHLSVKDYDGTLARQPACLPPTVGGPGSARKSESYGLCLGIANLLILFCLFDFWLHCGFSFISDLSYLFQPVCCGCVVVFYCLSSPRTSCRRLFFCRTTGTNDV